MMFLYLGWALLWAALGLCLILIVHAGPLPALLIGLALGALAAWTWIDAAWMGGAE